MHVVERDPTSRTAHVRVAGSLAIDNAGDLYRVLLELRSDAALDLVVLDFSDVHRVDTAAVAMVAISRHVLPRARVEVVHLDDRARALFAALPSATAAPTPAARRGWRERLGRIVEAHGVALRALIKLIGETIRVAAAALVRRVRLPAGEVGRLVVEQGLDALPLVALLGGLLGVAVGFQSAVELRRFGADIYVGDLVGLSMVRELGPLLTAIVITGRTGAAIAAELGTMRVGAEIDALSVMGISPLRYLVVPRMIALTIVQPVLTLAAMFVGMTGGMAVATRVLGVTPFAFWHRTLEVLALGDFARGLAKSFAFAWIIGFSAIHCGLRANRDASSVGRVTTRAVVAAIFWIVVFDAGFEIVSTLARLP